MPRVAHVPDTLRRIPFRGSDAVASGLLTRRQLDSKVWVRILRDVYRHVDLPETDAVRAQALRAVLPPDGVVRGRTAAWLHGVWQPRPGQVVPLEFARPTTASSTALAGARQRRLEFLPTMLSEVPELSDGCVGDLVEVHDAPTTSVLRTCFELMRDRPLVEAVTVADAFAFAGVLTLPWLSAYVELHRGWPGVRQARMAVELASCRSRSPGESRLRMIVVLGGLPEPIVNVAHYADRGRTMVGIPDLYIRDTPHPVGLEYDGAYHDDSVQRTLDNRRENRFAAELHMSLLRFGATDVRSRYHASLEQIVKATGWRHRQDLLDADFRRTAPGLAW